MSEDVAVWLPRLIADKWDLAVESLRAEGQTIPKDVKPLIGKASDPKLQSQQLRNAVTIQVYQAVPERSVPQSWYMSDRDVFAQWSIDIQAGGAAARERIQAAAMTVDRFLALHRKHPHTDWHTFDSWDQRHIEDYADYQHRVFNVRMGRYGEVLPSAIADIGA